MPEMMPKKRTLGKYLTIVAIVIVLSGFGVYGVFKFYKSENKSQEPRQPEQPAKELPKYFKLEDVKLHLDCNSALENHERAEIFRKKYQGGRIVFSEMVLTKTTNTEYALQGWMGASISNFNCLPNVVLSGDNKIQVEVDKAYEFDCRIADFCEKGIIDGEIRFDDCNVLKAIK
jgi:hypothetical protein